MLAPRIREFFPVDTGWTMDMERGIPTQYECLDTRTSFASLGFEATEVSRVIFTAGGSYRRHLVPLVKALIKIIDMNVNPRDSDARKVCGQDQIILYSLMTRNRAISYAFNAMANIWWYFNTRYRKITPHFALISAFIARVLDRRVHMGIPPVNKERQLTPNARQFKTAIFEERNGRRIIRHTDNHTEYVFSEAPIYREEQMPEHHHKFDGHQYGVGSLGARAGESDFAAFSRRYDMDMAAITAQLERQTLAIEETHAISATHFYTDEYYAHMAYRGGRGTIDPMDVDGLHRPYHPAPVYWRSGDVHDYPPHVHYSDYRTLEEGQNQHQFNQSIADSIFGYPPPYPHYPPPPQ